jgi:GNAT superfamily N-acetyltransferase
VAGDRLPCLTHYLYHRSTTRVEPTCYQQDLYTHEAERGLGISRALIEGVYRAAGTAGIRRVYWRRTRPTPPAGSSTTAWLDMRASSSMRTMSEAADAGWRNRQFHRPQQSPGEACGLGCGGLLRRAAAA